MLLTLRTTNRAGADARAAADAVITALTPAAWYRNATDVVSSGGFASIWADYASTAQGLALPGTANNNASSASAIAPTDLDCAARVVSSDWTRGASVALVSKDSDTAGQRGWFFYFDSSNLLAFYSTTDGTTAGINTNSTVAPTLTDGTAYWLRVTVDVDDGAGNRVIKFYSAADSATYPASWTQVGTTRTLAGTTNLFQSTGPVRAGDYFNGGSAPFLGTIYRAIVKDGIDGTTVFDADFSAQAIGTASFTESSSNAATVTINASGAAPAHIGKARDLLQGTGTNQPAYAAGVFTFDGVDNFLQTAVLSIAPPFTFFGVFKQISWTSTDALVDGGAVNQCALSQLGVTPAIVISSTGTSASNTDLLVGANAIVVWGHKVAGSTNFIQVNSSAETTGGNVLATTATRLSLGNSFNTRYANMECQEFGLINGVIDATQRSDLITALNGVFSVY